MRIFHLLVLCAFTTVTTLANPISRNEALQKARQFMPTKQFTQQGKSFARIKTAAGTEPFYVFNDANGNGFVVVSGDDRTREILGYSPTGALDMDNLPANLQWWLDEYARQIAALGLSTVVTNSSKVQLTAPAIPPLIHTKWSQEEPYNNMCPDGSGRDYDESGYDASNSCPTGCVATTMAQVMYYWKWPESCPALDAYSTKNFEVKSLPSTTFKWDLMKDSYSSIETGDAADAVAELMRYCGQAVWMDYDVSASGAPFYGNVVLARVFNYSRSIRTISRKSYNIEDWENIIYHELAEGRPVIYSGFSDNDGNGGHEFIVDGYASDGLFHMNWGWSGLFDNYFVLSVADPYQPGIDGSSSSGGFRYNQLAMVGIKPFREGEKEPYALLSDDAQTVTFYYDGHMISRKGMVIGVYDFNYNIEQDYRNATAAVIDDSFAEYYPFNIESWFTNCHNLKEIKGISNLHTDYVTDMSNMFSNCSSLTNLDLSGFKTNYVTDMGYMFNGCSSLTNLDLGGFKTDNVTNMNRMFYNCSNLTSLNLSGFKTDYLTVMSHMFYNCSSLTSLDLSGFKTDSVTNMGYMFYNCSNLKALDLSNFKTDNVTDMREMFSGCSELASLDLSSFKTDNVAGIEGMGMYRMFYNCSSLTSLDLSGFKTENVTNMQSMFEGCSSLTSLDLSSFNAENVTDMYRMFGSCSSLTSLNLSDFKTDNVTNMREMFSGCSSLTSLDLSAFNTGNVTTMWDMFSGCTGLTNLDLSGFNTENVTLMGNMFRSCSSLTSLDLSGFNTSNVTDMRNMFNRCSSLTSLDLSNFDTSNVTNMSNMFNLCSNLTTIYAGDGWSTDKVENSSRMFLDCRKLVGGQGTAYNYLYTDHTYARIDGGVESPGYFTYRENTGITVVNTDDISVTGDIFDVKGLKHHNYIKGLNIIHMSDGTVRKIVVKISKHFHARL